MKNYKFTISGNSYEVDIIDFDGDLAKIEVNGTPYMVEVHQQVKQVKTPTLVRPVAREPHKKIEKTEGGARITVKSPLPGVIIQINVSQGDKVTRGQKLLVMEAMKMENEIKSDTDGVITAIKVAPGQSVLQDEVMLEIN
ncbi:MAG: biotin/lipoyl-binding protein [Bacteroidales bacterium]|nr:biotin/lipoyl-binding protein [Bacteroidales bacterium]